MKITFIKPEQKQIAKVSFNVATETKIKLDRIAKTEQLTASQIMSQLIDQVYEQNYSKEFKGQ